MFTGIFTFIFLFLFIIFIVGFSLLRGVLNLLFGHRSSRRFYTTHHGQGQSDASSDASQHTSSSTKKRDKIFDDSEGEYVDFEEIRE